jgi:hypothetical protein
MQATQTTRRFHPGQIKYIVLSFALIASLAIGAAALTLGDAIPTIGRSDSHVVASAQRTSDELYALEANIAGSQVDGWQASVRQMTSDELWAIEASLVAAAARHQHNQSNQLMPDYRFIEQNLYLPESDLAPTTIGVDAMRFHEMNVDLPGLTTATAPDRRVLEEISWGHDFVRDGSDGSLLPSADDVPQSRPGQVMY